MTISEVRQVIFIVGTAIVLLSPASLILALLSLPLVIRHQAPAREIQRILWFGLAAFMVGGGLILASPLEPLFLGFGIGLILIGIWIGAAARRAG